MKRKLSALILFCALVLVTAGWQGISYPPPSSSSVGFGLNVINLTYSSIHIENAGSGDVDLFTVPSNSRAMVIWNAFNTAGTTTTVFPEVFVSAAYHRTDGNSSVNTITAASNGYRGIVLEAGQKFALNTSQSGMNIFGTAYVFSNTSSLRSGFLSTLASGDNTIYTCPTTKTSCTVILGNSQIVGNSNGGVVGLANVSGGALNFFLNIVSSGGSPGTANKATATTTVNNLTNPVFGNTNWTLGPGDFINMNASGTCTNCFAWATAYEQ